MGYLLLLRGIDGTTVASRGRFGEPSLLDSPRNSEGQGWRNREDPLGGGLGTGGGGECEEAPPAPQHGRSQGPTGSTGVVSSNTCSRQTPTSAL